MSNNNKRKYTIEFDVNKASLNQLKTTLQEIQKMSVGDFRLQSPQGFNSIGEAAKELSKIKQQASEVEKVLEKAFNPKLGVANLTQFTEGIKKIGVDDLTRGWAQLGAVGESATRHLATGLIATNTELKQSHKLLDDMATSFKNTVKWGISSAAFNTMTNSLQASWNFAQRLNKSLTDIRIVSEQSASQMEKFALQASKAAKELGATTLDYSNAALLYYQQGDTPEQVAEKANLTVKMANVLGASASEVSNYMTAIWNNFDDGSQSLEYYADVLTKLGAATASSAEEISIGLEKFASVAQTVDLSYEYATAALTTITATTRQSADIVGTALKTLFARIQDLELGETLDDGTTLGKYSEALEKIGISLKGQDGQIRSMDDLLDDMGSKWQTLTKNQKIALAQTVAGTRQYTQLIALMDNWDVMQQNITTAKEATGELQKQQDIYMDSTEAHLNKLTAATERFMGALVDEEGVNGLIDGLTSVVDLLANFIEGIGGGSSALLLFGSLGTKVFSNQIADSLAITAGNLRASKKGAEELYTAFKNLESFEDFLGKNEAKAPGILDKFRSVKPLMKTENIQKVNEYTQLISDAEIAEKTAWAERVHANNLLKDFGHQTENPMDADDLFGLKDFNDKIQASSKTAANAVLNFKKSIDSLYEPSEKRDLTKVIGNFAEAKKQMQDFSKNYGNAFEQDQIKNIEVNIRKLDEFIARLQELDRQKDSLADEDFERSLDDITQGEDAKLYKTMYDFTQGSTGGLTTIQKKSEYIFAKLGEEGIKAYQDIETKSKRTVDSIITDLDKLFNKLSDSKEIEKFVTGLSGIGQIASSLLSLHNLDDIWNNENLSGWEKFLQITLNLTTSLPMLAAGLKNFVSGFSEIINFFKGFINSVTFGKVLAENKALEESTDEVRESVSELNSEMSVGMSAATTARIANDNAIIASNNKVIASNRARQASELNSTGIDIFDDLLTNDPADMVGPKGATANDLPGLAEDIINAMGGGDNLGKSMFPELFDDAAGEVVEETTKKVLKKGAKEGIEEGVEAAVKNSGLFAGLKAKLAGVFGGGAAGASSAGGTAVLGAGLGKLALIAGGAAAAIGAVALVVAALTAEQRKAERELKALNERIEENRRAYESAANAYRSFSSTWDSFSNAEEHLKTLTAGTQEWRDAMVELNEQSMQLLNTYPELAKYMDTSKGYISFTSEGMEEYSKYLYAVSQVNFQDYRQAQADKLQWEFDQLSKSVAKAQVNFNKLEWTQEAKTDFYGGPSQFDRGDAMKSNQKLEEYVSKQFTNADAIRILQAFKGREDLLYSKDDNTEQILDLLKKNNIDLSNFTKDSQYEFVADLKSNATEIALYTSSIDEYTEKIAAYTRALLNTSEKSEGATDYEYYAAYNKMYDSFTYDEWAKEKHFDKVKDDKTARDIFAKEFALANGFTLEDYIESSDKGVKIGETKEDAKFYSWEDVGDKLWRVWREQQMQSEDVKNEINKNATAGTRKTQEFVTNEYYQRNQKVWDYIGDNKINQFQLNPDGTFTVTDTDDSVGEDIRQKIEDEINKDLQNGMLFDTEGKWKEKYSQLYPEMIIGDPKLVVDENGNTTYDIPMFFDENAYNQKQTQKFNDFLQDLFNNEYMMFGDFGITSDGTITGKPFPTSPGDGKGNIEKFSYGFHTWLDDLFHDRDVSALYTPEQNKQFYLILDEFRQSMSPEEWEKYYNTSISGKKIYKETVDEDGKIIKEGNAVTAWSKTQEFLNADGSVNWEKWNAKNDEEAKKYLEDTLRNSAEKNGESYEAYAAYADQLREDNKQIQAYNRSLREQNEIIAHATERHFKFAKQLKEVSESIKDNEDILKEWGKSGIHDLNALDPEDAKVIGEVVEAVKGMFGEEVDTNWVQAHIEEILKLANGDMSVYDDLLKDYMDYVVDNLDIHMPALGIPGITIEDDEEVRTQINDFLDNLPIEDIEIGTEITVNDQQFLGVLGKLVDAGAMTQEELEKMFGQYGFKVEWEEHSQPRKSWGDWIAKTFGIESAANWDGEESFLTPKLIWDGTNKKTFTPGDKITGGSKGGSSAKPRKQEKIKADPDIYHDVDVALEKIGNRLDKIQHLTDRHTGANWIENLNQQFETLNDQIAMTNEKIKIAEGEAADLRKKLEDQGVSFTADGDIANYFKAYDANLNKINSVIEHYNNLKTTEAQDKYQETYDKAREEWEEFLENIKRYDEVTTNLIPDLQQQNQEALDKQTELKIDAFKAEIEVRMDVAEAQRDWNQFKAKIIDGIEEDDILGNARAKLLDFSTYYNDEATGTIQRLTDYVADSLEQLKQFENGENMSIYDKFASNQLEDMRQFMDDLQAEMESLYELTEEIRASYLDMMDEAQEKFDEQLETYEQITSLIEHDMNLIRMVYGDDAYSELIDYYNQMHENNLETLDMHKQQVEFWANQMSILEEGSDEWQKAKENWASAVDGLTSATEESITTIQERFTNAIENIFKTLNNEVTNGKGLDYMSKEWDLINQNADRYLDNMDSIYAIQKLQNKYQEAIDTNDGIKAQRELKTIMDAELKALREKDKLTQYDVDRAELRYQIALKQIALEEAQQNKSKMRLRRDSQGNYTYQYTADEEQVSKLQGEMSDLYQQLYDLDANEYKNNLDQLQSVWIAFQEDMKAAEQINDEEAKQARKLLLTEQYGKLINDIVAHDETVKQNLYESTMSGLLDLYNSNELNYENMTSNQQTMLDQFLNDQEALTTGAYNNLFQLYDDSILKFKNMTDSQKSLLVSDMLPTWNTTLAEMMDTIAGNGGFEETCSGAFAQLELANEEYKTGLQQLQEKSGVVFTEIKNGYDKNTEAAKNLLKENNALITSYTNQLNEVKKVIEEMEALIKKYKEAETAAKNMGIAAEEAWKKARDKDADEKQDPTIEDDRKEDEKPTLPTPTETKSTEPEKPSLSIGSYVTVKPGTKWYGNSNGGDGWGWAQSGKISYTSSGPYGYNIGGGGWIRKTDIVGYNTGGYTGDWNGADGKLAMLHQKELVLNAEDTKNMLNAIQIVRTITDNLGATLLNKMNAIASNMGGNIFTGNDTLEQVVHIDAQFPNVTNSSEIEDALNNLVNRAAQHITKN